MTSYFDRKIDGGIPYELYRASRPLAITRIYKSDKEIQLFDTVDTISACLRIAEGVIGTLDVSYPDCANVVPNPTHFSGAPREDEAVSHNGRFGDRFGRLSRAERSGWSYLYEFHSSY